MTVIDVLPPAHFHVCIDLYVFPRTNEGVMAFFIYRVSFFLLFDWEQLHLFCHAHCHNNASYHNNLHLFYQ
jgi:hypothetical protein